MWVKLLCQMHGLSAEAIKQAGLRLGYMLSLIFNGCSIHNVLPQQLMDIHMVPVVKINVEISQIKITKAT